MLYIDLNMARAGVVAHPGQWAESGYQEVQKPPKRYRIIDVLALLELLGFEELEQHQRARANWVDAALEGGVAGRDSGWTESLAVGSEHVVAGLKQALGMKVRNCEVTEGGDTPMLREPQVAYRGRFGLEIGRLSAGNGALWEQS